MKVNDTVAKLTRGLSIILLIVSLSLFTQLNERERERLFQFVFLPFLAIYKYILKKYN